MKTQTEIIFETIRFYLDDLSRRAKRYNNTCFYADSTRPGIHCAVGRCMTPEALSKYGISVKSALTLHKKHNLNTLLQPPYRGHSIDFWTQLQNLHDSDHYWDGPAAAEHRENWFILHHPTLIMDAKLLRLI